MTGPAIVALTANGAAIAARLKAELGGEIHALAGRAVGDVAFDSTTDHLRGLFEAGRPIDASGGLPDGSEFEGVSGLEESLLKRPEIFVGTLAEKLLTFALGRGVEHYDASAIRKVVREARPDDYRFSSLIVGIATSIPFTMRRSE